MALETKNGNEAINPETNANVPIPDLKRAVERDLPLDSAVVFTGSWGNRSDCQSCYDPEEMEDVYSIVMSTLTVENDGESSGVSTPLAVATQQRVENTVIDLGAHFYDAQNDALKSFLPSQVGQVQGGLLRGLVVDFGFIAEERGGDMLDKLEVGVEMERRDNGVGINGNICELETEFENGFVNAGLCESRLERRYSKRLGREKVLGPIGRR